MQWAVSAIKGFCLSHLFIFQPLSGFAGISALLWTGVARATRAAMMAGTMAMLCMLGVKNLLLFWCQGSIKRLGRFTALVHRRIHLRHALGAHFLHPVDALRRCQLVKLGALLRRGTCTANWRL